MGFNEAESINFGTERWLESFDNYVPCCENNENTDILTSLKKIADQLKNEIICRKCNQKFSTEKALSVHKGKYHTSTIDLFECPECGTDFTSAYNLQIHIANQHDLDLNLDTVKNNKNTIKNTKKSISRLFKI